VTLVALDPGSRRAGVAVFASARPVAAVDLRTNRASVLEMVDEVLVALATVDPTAAVLVSEYPRRYATARAAWRDIDDLRAVVRAVEGWGWVATRRVAPGTWGSTVPKHIRALRTGEALTVADRLAVGWAGLGPDAKDALGIGLWALGPGRSRLNWQKSMKEDK
jgi:hypothetical protein